MDGILPSSLRLGLLSDTMGMMNSEKGACEHIHKFSGYQVDKPLSVNLLEARMVQEVSKGMNTDLGFTSISDVNHESIKSMDSDNEHVHAPIFSVSKGLSKSKKRMPKSIKKINPVLMTLGEDVLLNDIVLTNALTLVGRFGRHNYNAESLHGWVVKTWNEIISICPEIYILPRGWIAFKFSSVDEADRILAGVWKWDNAGLLIKK